MNQPQNYGSGQKGCLAGSRAGGYNCQRTISEKAIENAILCDADWLPPCNALSLVGRILKALSVDGFLADAVNSLHGKITR